MANFGTITLSNLTDPQPSYEWTRKALTSSINDFIRESLLENQHIPLFGVEGTILYPTAGTVPYACSPGSSQCGRLISFVPGTISESEYDSVAAKAREGSDYWTEFFGLIGEALFRSKLTVAPYVPDIGKPGYSTWIVYTSDMLSAIGSKYKKSTFSPVSALYYWRAAGSKIRVEIEERKPNESAQLWNFVSERVRNTAIDTTNIKRKYVGNVQRSTDPEAGLLNGYIYGSLKF